MKKETYSAYRAFGALLFGTWDPQPEVQSRDRSETLFGTYWDLSRLSRFWRTIIWNLVSTARGPVPDRSEILFGTYGDLQRLSRFWRTFIWNLVSTARGPVPGQIRDLIRDLQGLITLIALLAHYYLEPEDPQPREQIRDLPP